MVDSQQSPVDAEFLPSVTASCQGGLMTIKVETKQAFQGMTLTLFTFFLHATICCCWPFLGNQSMFVLLLKNASRFRGSTNARAAIPHFSILESTEWGYTSSVWSPFGKELYYKERTSSCFFLFIIITVVRRIRFHKSWFASSFPTREFFRYRLLLLIPSRRDFFFFFFRSSLFWFPFNSL